MYGKFQQYLQNELAAIDEAGLYKRERNIASQQFAEIIASKDRCKAGDSAPARGLFLEQVEYPDELFKISL